MRTRHTSGRRARASGRRARATALALVVLAVGALGDQRAIAAPACTSTWDGGAGTLAWGTAANWSTDAVPTGSSVVCVPDLGAGVEVIHAAGTDTILSLQGTGGVQISGGTLTVTATADPLDQLVITGGSLSGGGTVRIGRAGVWSGGVMSGTGTTTVEPGATLTVSGATSLGDQRVLTVSGLMEVAGNLEIATIGLAGRVHVLPGGVLRKSAGAGASTISPPIDNDGTVEVTTAAGSSLILRGGSAAGTSTGTFGKADATGTVQFTAGTHTIGPATFAGGVQLNGATIVVPTATTISSASLGLSAGALTLEGTATLGGAGMTLTLQGGVLQGSGTVGGNVVNDGGTVRPGTPLGILMIGGSFTQNVGGTLETEMNGTTPGTGYDQMVVSGTATIGGTADVALLGGFSPSVGTTFDVIDGQTVTGTFATVNAPLLPADRAFRASVVIGSPAHERLTVVPTGPVPSLASAPLVSPPAANPGDVLSCSDGQWSESPTSFAYAWLSDGTVIAGESAKQYTVRPGDVGHELRCRVTATNTVGDSQPALSSNFVTPTAVSTPDTATPDTTPPDTTITSGPTGTTSDTTPTFGFSSSEAGSSFECRVDSGEFASCSSPDTTAALGGGSHTFAVRAIDADRNVDATPASRTFTVATAAPVPPLTPATCAGKAATIVGTVGNDKVTGTPGRDVIVARSGNDTIDGRGGNDLICGGAGRDRLIGGRGDDRLSGGDGNDELDGGNGKDELLGERGDDKLSGGPGNDRLNGGRGSDACSGGPGRNVIANCERSRQSPAGR